jgi:ADP-ribose pyrophosphatase YjhB (NUDIX family)
VVVDARRGGLAQKAEIKDMFSIGAFAIIFDEDGRVLLCHRRDMDLWNLPGGGMDAGNGISGFASQQYVVLL